MFSVLLSILLMNLLVIFGGTAIAYLFPEPKFPSEKL